MTPNATKICKSLEIIFLGLTIPPQKKTEAGRHNQNHGTGGKHSGQIANIENFIVSLWLVCGIKSCQD
jgi:hypothetical protein